MEEKERWREAGNGCSFIWGRKTWGIRLNIEDGDYVSLSLTPPPPHQFEPKLVNHNETMVHHIIVYACGNASVLPTGISDCYGADPAFSLCSQVIVGWAVGGTVSPVIRR